MIRLSAFVLLTVVSGMISVAGAQNADVLSGFATNDKEPIQIEADKLTILDKDKKAEFSGKVKVVQGEMTMTAETLIVFYSASAMDGMNKDKEKKNKNKKPKPEEDLVAEVKPEGAKDKDKAATENGEAPKGTPQITRIVAEGGIRVQQRDQVATGKKAVYEAATQVVKLSGDVVLTQGKNVVKGDTLVVNLATRESQIVSAGRAQDAGRVTFIGTPGSDKKGEDKGKAKDAKKN